MENLTRLRTDPLCAWFTQLNEASDLMYAGVATTFMGHARGTELAGLCYAILGLSQRVLFVMNGKLTFMTTYTKTEMQTGREKHIARCPSWQVSRLVLFLLGYIYPVAARVATVVFDSKKGQSYRRYIFIHSGNAMSSQQLSNVMRETTGRFLGRRMGHRDWRQTLNTILMVIGLEEQCEPEDDDPLMHEIHKTFGHSARIAQRHHGLNKTDAITCF